MRVNLCLLILFLLCASSAAAQVSCDSPPPTLLNLRLGMTADAVRNAFGKDLKVKVKRSGDRVFFQNFIKKPAPASLAGIRAVYLRFFNRELYEIEIFYEDSNPRQTFESFADELTAKFNLPLAARAPRAAYDCPQFTFTADKILTPHIVLTDKSRRRLAEESRPKS